MLYMPLSHIVSYISRGNPKFVYVILSFPPYGYQPADNRKSCILKRGEVITCMPHKCATEFVTSDEMTLCEFYGAILFRNENQYFFFVFLIKIILNFFFLNM